MPLCSSSKADGGHCLLDYSVRTPMETIFSGRPPAPWGRWPSVPEESFIVMDVGTTTDALVLDGRPLLSSRAPACSCCSLMCVPLP